MLCEREPLERCQMEVDSWNVTLGRSYQPHTTFSHWTLHNSYWRGTITITIIYYWRGTITVGKVHSIPCFTLFTLHSINLSLTIILKRHTITSFHTKLFIAHIRLKKHHTRAQTLGLECTAQHNPQNTKPTPTPTSLRQRKLLTVIFEI